MNQLEQHIQSLRLMDTHEHLRSEDRYVSNGPDILQDLFDNYVAADLVVAGASQAAVTKLLDASDPDVATRFAGVQEAWRRCQHTGYGEAVRLIAQRVYGMEQITPVAITAAQSRAVELHKPGERLRILQEEGNLDHVQIDDGAWLCAPDVSGPDFFLYDLSWVSFCNGEVNVEAIYNEVGVEVRDVATLREAMAAIFARHAPCAIAVKSQHAYDRTLRWQPRADAETGQILQKQLAGIELKKEERLCLGDWCWARGVELSIEHNLPFKIHTGYYAGHSHMPVDRIRSGHLCPLLMGYPQARFVLMHLAYPYSHEVIALAKHFPNVYVDLCWSWSIDPYSAQDAVRRLIHAAPGNKVFAFGGDTFWPHAAVAYATQARRWLARALRAEVDDDLLSEREAMAVATRLMRTNQEECFDIEGTRAAIRNALSIAK